MKHDRTEQRRRAEKRAHVIRTAEWVLARAYRACTLSEIKASQWRIRQSVVDEMRRRIR